MEDSNEAIVLALTGELGAGKTTFVQGFLKGLGAKGRAKSPTFVIMQRHPFRRVAPGSGTGSAFHIDAYRLKKSADLAALGLKELMADRRSVILIEWAEKVRGLLPKHVIRIVFRHGKKENERRIMVMTPRGRQS